MIFSWWWFLYNIATSCDVHCNNDKITIRDVLLLYNVIPHAKFSSDWGRRSIREIYARTTEKGGVGFSCQDFRLTSSLLIFIVILKEFSSTEVSKQIEFFVYWLIWYFSFAWRLTMNRKVELVNTTSKIVLLPSVQPQPPPNYVPLQSVLVFRIKRVDNDFSATFERIT